MAAEQIKAFISGGFGGASLVFVGHPFDTVKVRLQTSSEYKGIADCVRKTVQRDGIRGLYRGMAAPLIGVTPIFAVYFWGFDLGKQIANQIENKPKDAPASIFGTLFAGGFSALPGTVVMVPGDRIKVILQIQGQSNAPPKYNGPIDCFKKVLKEEGVAGLYKGTLLTLARDVPGSVAYYAGYDLCKALLTTEGETASSLVILFCGGMAGIMNWIVAVPPDTLKSRFQTAPPGKYSGISSVLKELIATDGVAGVYKGLGPAMLRAFPANAACFLGVETSRKLLNSLF